MGAPHAVYGLLVNGVNLLKGVSEPLSIFTQPRSCVLTLEDVRILGNLGVSPQLT